MGKVIKLQQYQAIIEGLKALSEFEKKGDRKVFKKWREKYSESIEKEREEDDRQTMGKDREFA